MSNRQQQQQQHHDMNNVTTTSQNIHIDVHQGLNHQQYPVTNHYHHQITNTHHQNPITPPPSYCLHDIVHITDSHGSNPPSYEDAIDPNAPPPSYDSLYGRFREVHRSSTGTLDFFKNFVILLLGTLGCSIIIGITIIVPCSMVVIGIIYIDECPKQKYIPYFLLVGGVLAIVSQCVDLWLRVKKKNHQSSEEETKSCFVTVQSIISRFLVIWFVVGSFLIYQAYEPSYNPHSIDYCNKTLYLFAFWFHTAFYIIIALTTCCLCSATVALMAVAAHEK